MVSAVALLAEGLDRGLGGGGCKAGGKRAQLGRGCRLSGLRRLRGPEHPRAGSFRVFERLCFAVAGVGCLCGLLPAVAPHLLRGHRELWPLGTLVAAAGLSGTGPVAAAHELRCSVTCEIFLGLGIEPMSPALAGRFFTSEPPGEPLQGLNTHLRA